MSTRWTFVRVAYLRSSDFCSANCSVRSSRYAARRSRLSSCASCAIIVMWCLRSWRIRRELRQRNAPSSFRAFPQASAADRRAGRWILSAAAGRGSREAYRDAVHIGQQTAGTGKEHRHGIEQLPCAGERHIGRGVCSAQTLSRRSQSRFRSSGISSSTAIFIVRPPRHILGKSMRICKHGFPSFAFIPYFRRLCQLLLLFRINVRK